MISYASIKLFIISLASKLRVRVSTPNITVVIVDPDFINSRNALIIVANTAKHGGPQLIAAFRKKEVVGMGGVGVVNLPIVSRYTHFGASSNFYLRAFFGGWGSFHFLALNPICKLDSDAGGSREEDNAIWARHFRSSDCLEDHL